MAFDYAGAREAGYSDQDIANFLAPKLNFNLEGALSAGYNYSDIAANLVSTSESQDTSMFREALDVPILAGQGATQLIRMGTQAFGADNPVANTLMGVEDYLGSLISAASRNQQEEIAQIFADAEGKGFGAQVQAGLKALTVAPADTLAQFGGTAVPFIAANILTGGAATPALALGATTGVGLVKGTIFDAVSNEYIKAGVDPEQAEQIATEAQAYMGDNIDQIALGGVLGAAAGRLGIERGISNLVTKNVGAGMSLPTGGRAIVGGALAESIPEAVQAGQEKFASNLARQRKGFDVDLMEGVVGQSVFEGGAGLVLGGGVGLRTSAANRQANRLRAEEQAELLKKKQEEEIAIQDSIGEVMAGDLDTTELPDDYAAVDLSLEPEPTPEPVPEPEPLPARDLDVKGIEEESIEIIRQTNPREPVSFVSEPTADGRGYQIKGSDGREYGAPVTEAEPARQLAFRLNERKNDQKITLAANESINRSGLSGADTSTLTNYRVIGSKVLNPRFNEVTAAEINFAADAATDESILEDRRRQAIQKLPLEQAEYYLTRSAPANRAKSNAEKMRLLTPVQRENLKRREKGLPEKSTFSMAEARRILGKNFGNLADPQADITPEVEYLASISSTSIPISRREKGSPKKARTLLNQGVYKFAEGAPAEVSLDTLGELLEEKNIASSIKSKEMKPLIKAFTGAGSYKTMNAGDRRVLYQKINMFSDFASPSKLPLFETLQVTTDDDIVTPDAIGVENETSKQRAEFIKNFRREQNARPYAESEARRGESAYIRRSYGRQSGPYERRISRDDGRDGLLALDPSQNAAVYQDTGLSLPQVFEVDAELEADTYYNDMVAAMAGHKYAAQVEIKEPSELSKYRLYRTPNGSGFAIKPDGDIVAVFASQSEPRGGSYALLQAAVQAGGKKLDAFNTYLPKIYSRVGFRPVARIPWNDEFAPPNWDKDTFRKFSDGEPEIYFFVHDPFYYGESVEVPLVQEYDAAVELQNQALQSPLSLPSAEVEESPRQSGVAADESRRTVTDPEMTQSQAASEVANAQQAALRFLRGTGMPRGFAEAVSSQAGGIAGSNFVNGTQKPTQSDSWYKKNKAFDSLRFNVQDKYLDLLRVEEGIASAAGLEAIPTLESAYLGIESISGKAGNQIKMIEDNEIKPLLSKLNDLGISREDFNDFLILRHAIERNDFVRKRNESVKGTNDYNPDLVDGGSGELNGERLTDAYVKQVMARDYGMQWDNQSGSWVGGNQLAADMLNAAQDFDALNQAALDDELRYGLISQEQFKELSDKFKYYVPMKGKKEDPSAQLSRQDEIDQNARGAGGIRKLSTKGAEGKKIRGRVGSQAFDPLANSYSQRLSTMIRGLKNQQFGQRLYNLVQNNPNPDYWEILGEGEKIPSGMTSIGVKIDGKQQDILIYDKRLRDALTGMDAQQALAITKIFRGINRFLSAVNTSYNPEFVISNFARDVQTALANVVGEQNMKGGKAKGIVGLKRAIIKDTLPSVGQVYKGFRGKKLSPENQKLWDIYLSSGAKTDFFYAKSPSEIADDIDVLDQMARGTFTGTARKKLRAVKGLVEDANGAIENGVRFATFKQARQFLLDQKLSEEEANAQAATLAKNLTVNFNRKGNMGEGLNAAYLFFNASVQGTANFARGMSSRRKQGMMAAMATFGALITYLNQETSDEEEGTGRTYYDNIPDYEKERNLILMKSWANVLGDSPAGEYYKIPLPYGYNVLHLIGLNSAEILSGEKSVLEATSDLTSAAIGSFSPLGFSSSENKAIVAGKAIVPQAFKPAAELMVNENHFGAPIYREDFPFAAPTPASSRSMRSTPEFLKNTFEFLNEMTIGPFSGGNPQQSGPIDISPDVANHLLQQFTGGAGATGLRSIELTRKLYDGEDVEVREIPFIRKIMGEANLMESQNDYYDRRENIRQVINRLDNLRGPDRVQFRRDNLSTIRMNSRMKSTDKRIRSLNKRLDEVRTQILETPDTALRLRLQDTEEKLQEQKESAIALFNRRYDEMVGRTE